MSTLFELSAQYQALLEMAEDPETDPEALEGSMEAIGDELNDKLDGYAAVITQLKGDVETIKTEVDRLTQRKRTIEANIDRMMLSMQNAIEATGQKKIRTATHSFGIQKTPAKVVMDTDDLTKIPEEYLVIRPAEVSKSKIKDALKAGTDLTGIAHLEQGDALRIR